MFYRDIGLRMALLGCLAAVLSGCSIFGGDEEVDPPAELIKFEPALKIRKAWSAGIGDGTKALRLALSPDSDGSRIYAAAHDGRIAAFDAASGKRQWSIKTKLPLAAGPATDGIIVAAGSSDGDVIAVRADDGTELWRTKVSSEVLAAPAVTRDYVLVRSVDGKLIALRAADGSEAWFVQQNMPRLSVRGTGSPVVRGDRVICGFDNGKLSAYQLSDGALAWDVLLTPPSGRTEVERLSDINATVSVVGDDVYAAGYQGILASVAAESGQILWNREIPSYSRMAADFINVYVAQDNSEIVAVARRSGREMWRADTLLNRYVTGTAAVGNSVVVGDFEGYVHFFDATSGELQARVRAGSDPLTAPLAVNGMLYIQSENGKLFAFRDATKKPAEEEPSEDQPKTGEPPG